MIPDITYFILDYNPDHFPEEATWLKDCVLSIIYNTNPSISKTIYLLSQGAGKEHEKYLVELSRFFSINLICMRDNVGVSRGINYCVNMSRSPVVALVTSDTILTKGTDSDLYSRIIANDNVCQAIPLSQKSDIPYQQHGISEVYGDPIIKSPGKQDISCVAFELTINFWNRLLFSETVGFFDERWRACYENLDFGLRSFMSGGENIISGNSAIWHRHSTCYKNGLLKRAYHDYLEDYVDQSEPYEVYHQVLGQLWQEKWPSLHDVIDIYKPLGVDKEDIRKALIDNFEHNLQLSYYQDVRY